MSFAGWVMTVYFGIGISFALWVAWLVMTLYSRNPEDPHAKFAEESPTWMTMLALTLIAALWPIALGYFIWG